MLDVEKNRRDVSLIETGFLQSSWYFEDLRRRYPDLMRSCQTEARALLAVLVRFEQQPGLWKEGEMRSELNDRLDDLLLALIARHLQQRGPVYMTIDTALGWSPRDAKFIQRLTTAYDVVPRGSVVEIMPGHSIREVQRTPVSVRGLIDGTVQYESDDVVPTELVPAYAAAFLMRARYLVILGRFGDAVADYEQALALDPENSTIERELMALKARPH